MIATASALGALALVRAMQPALEAPLAEQAGNAAAPVDMAAATALPAMPETAGETAAKPALRVAGLRLRIDETISSTPVSDAVNEVDARLHSLIERHDRLVEMAADLNESGIAIALKADDLVPASPAAVRADKPRVMDASSANAKHPLFGFVREIRSELAMALKEEDDKALKRIEIINSRLDALAIRQFGVLDRMEKKVEGRHTRMASVPRALGISVPSREETGHQGGPLVPLSGTSATIYAFETRMEAVELTLARLTDIGRIIERLPVRRPVGPQATISSGYGPRRDPFLGKPAMHLGLDFRAARGAPVMAAGAGRVIRAGRLGGYGNVVEIDHGQGLTSRYAHLSRIGVKKGDTVRPGDVVGKVGSTGRSTGPHLHFEVRRNGATRNPRTYIRAGRRLQATG